jgi:rhodanese-related sulfurtransferase
MGLEAPDPIIDLADLQAALIHSLERVENGAAVVLDVRVRQEYVGDEMVELS